VGGVCVRGRFRKRRAKPALQWWRTLDVTPVDLLELIDDPPKPKRGREQKERKRV
jgi:hypothetical protein